ncbi:MbtH family NRPS accessory protein [Micromonospora peucetia]|jgi:MbtH protein|uniref:MbtH family NRPS accessory protein n=2 Tax=Micromonospora TaxID=1873 RepID=A0A1C6VVD7_9ACTN|nr:MULTISPECIES: MbtH family NRPS accessory protein [Micromonospora]KAB1159142.1 MbtH family NRPS accessory protein [Micromonospora sp. AMSO12t]MBQ1075160.1 MbtH family NRPS accessory protein [Micromonospora sp. C31]MCX4388041.1 MbtH family NRPS accessory protein [Micromonospora peucetia]MDT0527966.1 MbtH family NRPS accessory protein [Micromonospora sp. DSM 115977]WSA31270.1 MbtH family NRPS accessory protein [Micromonospora peucetia]
MSDENTDERAYRVVVNDEEQYSIWLGDRELPLGWRAEGTEGTREECLKRIDEVWTDMRPLSLRRRMEQAAGR